MAAWNGKVRTTTTRRGSVPFLKWPGGKRRLVPYLLPHLGLPVKRLVEPFCGSCALSLAVGDRAERFWLNDRNPDLMNLLLQLKRDPGALIARAKEYFIPENNHEKAYYRLRERFNEEDDPLIRAALFLYLNRHGYNGLCRYNAEGGFNVPFGRYRAPHFPEKEILAAAAVLARAELTICDFEEVMEACRPGDVVYCDPPYVPLSATASFTAYAAGGFGPADQARLANAAARTAARGIPVVVSNHDTPLTRELYRGARLESLDVRRNISCNGANRALVKEIVAVYHPAAPAG
ncbi:MAG: Dam family site-specific DNA-(adenine-N6)-methyltransferase [Firmicutes bacterium]|nr:Dam family site-specific DNA-(adenine-N6)-methyltransferase [Bacillota bacterium]